MKVIPKELLTFLVESSSGNTYEVNLAARRPHGWCSCEDYQFRQAPHQHTNIPQRCKHIIAVREYVVERVITEVVSSRQAAIAQSVAEAEARSAAIRAAGQGAASRPAQVRALPDPPVDRPAPPDPPERRPVPGARTGQLGRPVSGVPQLGRTQSGKGVPSRMAVSVNRLGSKSQKDQRP